ncbi:MAG: hypothetical protein AB7F96_13115 [Beijerinckiaceae bacterium]
MYELKSSDDNLRFYPRQPSAIGQSLSQVLAGPCIPFRELEASEAAIRHLHLLRLVIDGMFRRNDGSLKLAREFAARLADEPRRDLLVARMSAFAMALWCANADRLAFLPAPCRCASPQEVMVLGLWGAFLKRDPRQFAAAVDNLAGRADPAAIIDLGSRLALELERSRIVAVSPNGATSRPIH